MTVARYNYTERQTIAKSNVGISVTNSVNGPEFRVDRLDLDDYNLPDDSRIYIEAFRGSTYKRYIWGTVGNRTEPASTSLSDIDAHDNYMFRVKIADVRPGKAGKIIANCEGISCTIGEDGEGSAGLKTIIKFVMPKDPPIDRIWKLSLEDEGVEFLANSNIEDVARHVETDNRFAALVFPEICRQVFNYICERELEEDQYEWVGDWLQFGRILAGNFDSDCPDESWIDDVVRNFVIKKDLIHGYREAINAS